jgi:hypothetical protein
MNRRQALLLAAICGSAATLLVGGITWAAIPGDGGVINACYGKVGGVVRVIDTAKREKCLTAIEVPLSWNQQGQKGDPGTPGASPAVVQLEANDANCPAGGAAITDAAGHTAYVCSAQPFSGTFTSPSGEYSVSVTDEGITLSRGNTAAVSINGQDIAIVAERDATITVGRDLATSVGGALDTTVGADAATSIGGNLSTSVGADSTTTIGGDTNTLVGGSASRSVIGAVNESVGTNLTIDVSHNTSIQTAQNLNVSSDGDTQILSGGEARLQSSGVLTLRGSTINFN